METKYEKFTREKGSPRVNWDHIRKSNNVLYLAVRELSDGKEYEVSLDYSEDTEENFNDFKNWADIPFLRAEDKLSNELG
jgi:hypothetical protein